MVQRSGGEQRGSWRRRKHGGSVAASAAETMTTIKMKATVAMMAAEARRGVAIDESLAAEAKVVGSVVVGKRQRAARQQR